MAHSSSKSSNQGCPPAIRPGTIFWTKDEDTKLIKLVMEHGKNWRMMRDYFPSRSESSIKCRWHVYLKQNVKGEPPEYKKSPNECERSTVRRKRKKISKPRLEPIPFVEEDLLPRKSTRKRFKPRNTYSPSSFINQKTLREEPAKQQGDRFEGMTYLLTGSVTKESRVKTKYMLNRISSKTDLELDDEERVFFKDYCFAPMSGTPMASRISAASCLGSFFYTKVGQEKLPIMRLESLM